MKKNTRRKKKFAAIIMKSVESNYRIIKRKNNPAGKPKLKLKKYCPVTRKRLTFTEWKNERYN